MAWLVFLTEEAEQRLLAIKDRRIRKLALRQGNETAEKSLSTGKTFNS